MSAKLGRTCGMRQMCKVGLACLLSFLSYGECRAQQSPVVEIEINRTPDTNDDFVTWSPTFCRARAGSGVPAGDSLAVTLSNSTADLNGKVRFAPAQSPWPANTTASLQTLNLNLPGNGDWVDFVVAGDFGHASVRRADTVIVCQTAAGVEVGRQSLMVRVRKDARKLTTEERDRLLGAIGRLHLVLGRYENYVTIHQIGLPEAHGGSAFPAWHRAFILHLERALQGIDPAISLPYWKYDEPTSLTKPPENLQVYGNSYMGGDSSTGFAAFSSGHPFELWTINGLAGIDRGRLTTNHHVLPHIPGQPSIEDESGTLVPITYDIFTNGDPFDPSTPGLEKNPHGYAHVWAGLDDGWIRQVRISPRDPLFFLLHCNVDRQWARWQWQHNRFGVTSADFSPTGTYPGTSVPNRKRIGHYLDETMWPWNGKHGDPGTPSDPLDDRPESAPGGAFPPVSPFSFGPPSIPKNRDLIDYLGRLDTGKGLGFCYDDIPFNPATSPPPSPTEFVASELATLLDDASPLAVRVAVAKAARRAKGEQLKKVFALVGNDGTDANLRLAAFQGIPMPAHKESLDELVKLSKDKKSPLELRRNVANRLHFALNFSPLGHTDRGVILEALRGLLDDTDLKVRELATGSLVGFDDAATLERLAEGLKDPAKELLPAQGALRLLSGTSQPGFYELFKKYFEDKSNPATRNIAARGLARFPQGVPLLRATLLDKLESEELRMTILAALNANDREEFPNYAIDVADDANAPEPLRTYALAATANHVESAQLRQTPTRYNIGVINMKVRELASKAEADVVRKRAWGFLQQCDKDYLNYAPDLINKEPDQKLRLHLKEEFMRKQNLRNDGNASKK